MLTDIIKKTLLVFTEITINITRVQVLILLGLVLNSCQDKKHSQEIKDESSLKLLYLGNNFKGLFERNNPQFIFKVNEIGFVVLDMQFSNNGECITANSYYSTGEKKLSCTLKRGKLDGKFEFYRYRGGRDPMVIGQLSEGLKDGIWLFYDFENELWKKVEYSKSKVIETSIVKPQPYSSFMNDQFKLLYLMELKNEYFFMSEKKQEFSQRLIEIDSLTSEIKKDTAFWKNNEKEYERMSSVRY